MCLWRILCGVRDSKVKVEGRKVKVENRKVKLESRKVKVGGRKEQCDFASRGAKKLIFQLVKHFVFIKVFLASRAHKALRARRYVSGLSIRSALRTPAGALGLPPSGRHPCTSLMRGSRIFTSRIGELISARKSDLVFFP